MQTIITALAALLALPLASIVLGLGAFWLIV